MTRAEMLARIQELQTQLDTYRPDPLKSEADNLAVSAMTLRSLTALQERLRRLEAHR
jgi:hypothetical protein